MNDDIEEIRWRGIAP